MTRRWILPVALAVAAGVVTYALFWHSTRSRSRFSLDSLQDVSFLTRQLQLTRDQAREIKALHAALGAELDTACRAHCDARARLGQALAGDAAAGPAVDPIVQDMASAYEDSEWATLNHIRAVRALLTPEQRTRFDSMITNGMCGPCNMPGGKAPERKDPVPGGNTGSDSGSVSRSWPVPDQGPPTGKE